MTGPRLLCGALLLTIGCGGDPSAQRTAATSRDLAAAAGFADQLDSLRIASGIPGLAVVLLRDTTVILARGFGFADIANAVPVTPETPFNIASVSKPISATLALLLVERGALDLATPMRRFRDWEEFCREARATGGLFYKDLHCEDDGLTLEHVFSMRADGVPGSRFFYNPPIYSWASRPIMERTGASFSDLVDSLILRPGRHAALGAHQSRPRAPARHRERVGAALPSGRGRARGAVGTAGAAG